MSVKCESLLVGSVSGYRRSFAHTAIFPLPLQSESVSYHYIERIFLKRNPRIIYIAGMVCMGDNCERIRAGTASDSRSSLAIICIQVSVSIILSVNGMDKSLEMRTWRKENARPLRDTGFL